MTAARRELRHAALDHRPRERSARGLLARVDAAQDGAGERRAVREETLDFDERLRAHDARLGRAARSARSRSASGSAGAGSVVCAESARSRVRSSPSNPFMTDRMAMSAATPRQIPASETQLMNDTKYSCWRALT